MSFPSGGWPDHLIPKRVEERKLQFPGVGASVLGGTSQFPDNAALLLTLFHLPQEWPPKCVQEARCCGVSHYPGEQYPQT